MVDTFIADDISDSYILQVPLYKRRFYEDLSSWELTDLIMKGSDELGNRFDDEMIRIPSKKYLGNRKVSVSRCLNYGFIELFVSPIVYPSFAGMNFGTECIVRDLVDDFVINKRNVHSVGLVLVTRSPFVSKEEAYQTAIAKAGNLCTTRYKRLRYYHIHDPTINYHKNYL